MRADWLDAAACRGLDPRLFDDDHDDPMVIANPLVRVTRREAAAAVCASCPVRAECLADALANRPGCGSPTTIRGGLTGHERYKLTREAS